MNLYRKTTVTIMVIAVLLPLIPLVFWSFSFTWVYPDLFPTWDTRAWEYVFSKKNILSGIKYSVLIATIVTVVCLLLAFTASKAIGTRRIKHKTALEVFFLMPTLVPAIALSMGMQWAVIKTPLYSSLTGMIVCQIIFALPYTIFCLSATFKNYDIEYEQQAEILGASKLDTLVYVTLPSIRSGLTVAILFTFLASWSQYLIITMVGDPSIKTLPVILFNMIGGSDIPIASALSLVFIAPVTVLLIISLFAFSKDNESGVDK